MGAIAPHHRQIFILAAAVEAEPETKTVRQRHLFLDRFARVDRGRALVLDHVARQKMAAVRSGVENDIVGTALDAAFQHRLQRLVGGVVAVEGEVVAEHDEAKRGVAQTVHQAGQTLDVLAVNLDQLEPVGRLAVDIDVGMRRLHQRRFAHAACAPEQRIVGGQAIGEPLGVLDQDVAHPVDPLEQAEVDAADARDRRQPSVRVPDKGVGGAERLNSPGRRGGRGKVAGDGFQRCGNPLGRGVVLGLCRTFCRGFCGCPRGGPGGGTGRCFLGSF